MSGLVTGELKAVAGQVFVKGVKGTDENDDVVRQTSIFGSTRCIAHVYAIPGQTGNVSMIYRGKSGEKCVFCEKVFIFLH